LVTTQRGGLMPYELTVVELSPESLVGLQYKTPHFHNRVNVAGLDCKFSDSNMEIPYIDGLITLDCRFNRNLQYIPSIDTLREIHCEGCFSLTPLPKMGKLEKIYCWGCCADIGINNKDAEQIRRL